MRTTLRVLWDLICLPVYGMFIIACVLIPIPGWIILAIWHSNDKRAAQHRELMKVIKHRGA